LRHTSATLALASGASLEQVREMLGHTNLAVTSIYVHAVNREANDPAQLIGVDL
jgi:integrase/recombinase XerD